jgi:hypothetical protein
LKSISPHAGRARRQAQVHINSQFNARQQAFQNSVLSHYYVTVTDLGKPAEIGKVFGSFQKNLYAT